MQDKQISEQIFIHFSYRYFQKNRFSLFPQLKTIRVTALLLLSSLEFKEKVQSPYESKKANSVTENKSEDLWKVSLTVQSTTSNYLTVP